MKPTEEIVEPLLQWYDKNARVLPWREEPTPYRVWVSEIMLQQTRVEAVKPYFERFLVEFPNVQSLAKASEERLLKMWEGLGYYNRARNLQKAAVKICEEFNGNFPADYELLLTLPGVGSYTAGAVASIAFLQKVPAVDGNVLRIIARLCADDSDILDGKVKKSLEENMKVIMPADRSGDFNQALMELGATVCIPNGMPKCSECPWEKQCKAKKLNLIAELPKKKKKAERKMEKKTILVIRDEQKVAIRKRPSQGLLAGLYEFPMLEGHKNSKQILAYIKELGFEAIKIQKLENSKHIFSHKEWHMKGYAVWADELADKKVTQAGKNLMFVDTQETEEKYPIPAAFLAYANYLNIKLGQDKYKIKMK